MSKQGAIQGVRTSCPPTDQLLQWQQGHLPPEQVERLICHLDTCRACQKSLDALSAADPVCRHLRYAPPPVSAEDRTEMAGIVQRVRELAATPDPGSSPTRVVPGCPDTPFLSPPEGPNEIGRLGRYRIVRELGRGGMGLVFEAEDLQLQRPVAIKVLRPEAELRPGARERFLREARAAAAVRHEHVVTIHHVDETKDVPYLVMELLAGQSLEARCHTSPPLTVDEIVRIGRETAEGLAAAHEQGLIHRDIKPDNIFLASGGVVSGEPSEAKPTHHSPLTTHHSPKVKLLDFGLARAPAGDVQLTQNGLIVGTPAYMSPEQASGGPIDARSDLFSLGCVLFRLVAGRVPFQGKTPLEVLHALANEPPPPLHQLMRGIPESLSRLVARLLARNPADRPASAQAVADALAAIPAAATDRAVASRSRSAGVTLGWAMAASLLALVVAAGSLALLRFETEHGEIVIRANDPDVAVLFERDGVQLHDRRTNRKYSLGVGRQKLPGGDYEIIVTDESAGLSFSAREFILKRGEPIVVQVHFQPKPPAPRSLPPVPADGLQRSCIPADLLARAGKGDGTRALPELVAVLGGARHFPLQGTYLHGLYTRFSPDGRLLVTIALNDVLVYEASTGRLLQRLQHERGCGWFDFHPDNKSLAVSSEGGNDFWDLSTGELLARWTLADGAPMTYGLAYTPDGQSLVTADSDGKARVWKVGSRKVVRMFEPPEGHRFIQAPQIHPQGRLIALHATGPKPVVRVLDLTTGEQKAELPGTGHVAAAPGLEYQTTARFSPDGKLLANMQESKAVHFWEVGSWKDTGPISGDSSILNFAADGKTLYRAYLWSGGGDGGIHFRLDDVQTRECKSATKLPVAASLAWSDLSPDGKTVAVRASGSNCVEVFDAETGLERFRTIGHRGRVSGVAVSPDGRWVASAADDHRLLLWDLKALAKPPDERTESVRELHFASIAFQIYTGASFSPDGKWVAALMSHANDICIWEATSGKTVAMLKCKDRTGELREIAFHPKGGSLVSTGKNRIEQWHPKDGSSISWGEGGHDKPITSVTYHPDGLSVASGDSDGVICLWDALGHERLRQFRCSGPVERVRFSPDGKMLAATTAAPDSALYLWDLQTLVQTRRVAHADSVTGLAWHPQGRALATASHDGTVRLWSLDVKESPRVFSLNAGKQEQPAFTPEGRHLLTANEDGTVFVLRLASVIAEAARTK